MKHHRFIAAHTREMAMRQMVLSVLVSTALEMASIAGSASAAIAAQPHHRTHVSTRNATSSVPGEPFRNEHDSLGRSRPPSWPYSGWSAPAGR